MTINHPVIISKNSFFPNETVEVSLVRIESDPGTAPVDIFISAIPFETESGTWGQIGTFDNLGIAKFPAPARTGMYALATNENGTTHIEQIFTVTEDLMAAVKKGVVVVGVGFAAGIATAVIVGKWLANRKK